MDTGIHSGISFETYSAIKAANNSGLTLVERSPLHYFAQYIDPRREPRTETPAMKLGRAIHTAALEPHQFARRYHLEPIPEDFPGTLVSADDYRAACASLGIKPPSTKAAMKTLLMATPNPPVFFEDIAGQIESKFELLSEKQMEACEGIAGNVRKSDAAMTLLSDGKAEEVAVWKDPETGVLCKARLDWLSSDRNVIVDLKSTTDARPEKFKRSIQEYGYHRQVAWYLDGVEYASGTRPGVFAFIVYESTAPYAAAYYYADQEMITIGRRENRILLRSYADCLASGKWPGFPEELREISLPAWYTKTNRPMEDY